MCSLYQLVVSQVVGVPLNHPFCWSVIVVIQAFLGLPYDLRKHLMDVSVTTKPRLQLGQPPRLSISANDFGPGD